MPQKQITLDDYKILHARFKELDRRHRRLQISLDEVKNKYETALAALQKIADAREFEMHVNEKGEAKINERWQSDLAKRFISAFEARNERVDQ